MSLSSLMDAMILCLWKMKKRKWNDFKYSPVIAEVRDTDPVCLVLSSPRNEQLKKILLMIARVHCHLESRTFQKAGAVRELCCLAFPALTVLANALTSSLLRNRCFTEE